MDNFQRVGSISNAHVGREFKDIAQSFFKEQGVVLERELALLIGVGVIKKEHAFDLGNKHSNIIVECKSHKWTAGGKVPSAKLTIWNEAMYYFAISPKGYRKVFFVLKDYCSRREETLGGYYLRTYRHLIPDGVEIWEYDPGIKGAVKIL
jgi:hypothetical protein